MQLDITVLYVLFAPVHNMPAICLLYSRLLCYVQDSHQSPAACISHHATFSCKVVLPLMLCAIACIHYWLTGEANLQVLHMQFT